jgi:exodeoxyribonuclease-3
MKVISWNVNGLRAVNKKNANGTEKAAAELNVIAKIAEDQNPDVLCLQEIKTDRPQDLDEYKSIFPYIYVNSAAKKGYSGTAILSKVKPLKVSSNFEEFSQLQEEAVTNSFSTEGRILTAEFSFSQSEKPHEPGSKSQGEFDGISVICCYTVNAKSNLERLEDRQKWDELFKNLIILKEQTTKKPVIVVGDLNVAHKPIDLYNHKKDCRTAGLSKEEREGFSNLLEHAELTDAYRYRNPEGQKWSWWSPITKARTRDAGWRIDYTLVSNSLREAITEVDILNEYYGSDHCPVMVCVNS